MGIVPFPGQIDGIGNLRIAQPDAAQPSDFKAEMNAPQRVRAGDAATARDLAAEIGVFEPGVKRQALVEGQATYDGKPKGHVAAV